jgi:hypothetical protein
MRGRLLPFLVCFRAWKCYRQKDKKEGFGVEEAASEANGGERRGSDLFFLIRTTRTTSSDSISSCELHCRTGRND